MESVGCAELVEQYDRLQGSNLSMKGSALAVEIDKASGRMESEIKDFILWVYDVVWTRLPRDARVDDESLLIVGALFAEREDD